MKSLKASVWVMALIGGILTVGSIIVSFGLWDGFYKSPFLIIPVLFFVGVMVWCLVQFRFSWKKIGFYLCHVGILIIIVSSFLSWLALVDTSFAIPVNSNAFYGEVMQDDGSELRFGFDISVASFEVEKYEADYRLFDASGSLREENVLIETVIQDRKGIYDLGEYGSISASDLKKDGEYLPSYVFKNGLTLIKLAEVDKSYEAVLQIREENGSVHSEIIGVNNPYTYDGWKFYLMGYDEYAGSYVNLYVKKDPANIPFGIGIWCVIVGTFLECLPIEKRKGVRR